MKVGGFNLVKFDDGILARLLMKKYPVFEVFGNTG